MKIYLLLFCIMLSLFTGCRTFLATNINVSELSSPNLKQYNSDLYVEVSSCNAYEDSRNPSQSIIEAKKFVPDIFPDATYKECFSKQMDSFVHFLIPIEVGLIKNDDEFNKRTLKVFSYNKVMLGLHVPVEFKERLKKHNNDNYATNSITPESVFIVFNLHNDTSKSYSAYAPDVFINGYPNPTDTLTIPPASTIEIKLSNLDSAKAFLTKDLGGYGVLTPLLSPDD